MTALPADIRDFLLAHHVVGLATLAEGEPWAASCFYAFDEATVSLVILSSDDTRHARAMLSHPSVAGTIAGQPTAVVDIRGIQLRADAQRLGGEAHDDAYALYCKRHPIARLKPAPVWRLWLRELKFTDNARLFGAKTHWRRDIA